MSVWEVRLEPKGAFHLGERGIGYEETAEGIHADTLFGALCAAWAILYGEDALLTDLLPPRPIPEEWEPPFLLSSAFPYAGSVRFFPAPLLPPESSDPAAWANVTWVSEALFGAWIRKEPLEEGVRLHGGAVVMTREEAETLAQELDERPLRTDPGSVRLWVQDRVARVTLDSISHASQLWHFGRLQFHEGCGLFFLVRPLRIPKECFEAAMRLLGDTGIGGDRSAGYGLFEASWNPFDPSWWRSADPRGFVTLAPLWPRADQVAELLTQGCRYRLVTRTGWIGGPLPTPYRRKSVRMLAEGSVLGGDPGRIWGTLADVTPEPIPEPIHPVYRWGVAFPVPCEVCTP